MNWSNSPTRQASDQNAHTALTPSRVSRGNDQPCIPAPAPKIPANTGPLLPRDLTGDDDDGNDDDDYGDDDAHEDGGDDWIIHSIVEKKDPKEEASKIEASGETAQDSNQTVWFLSKEASVLEDLGCSHRRAGV